MNSTLQLGFKTTTKSRRIDFSRDSRPPSTLVEDDDSLTPRQYYGLNNLGRGSLEALTPKGSYAYAILRFIFKGNTVMVMHGKMMMVVEVVVVMMVMLWLVFPLLEKPECTLIMDCELITRKKLKTGTTCCCCLPHSSHPDGRAQLDAVSVMKSQSDVGAPVMLLTAGGGV